MRHSSVVGTLVIVLLLFPGLPLDAQDYVLQIEGEATVDDAGESTTITVGFENAADPVGAIEYGVCHDDALLTLDSADFTFEAGFLDTLAAAVTLEPGDGYTVGIIMDVVTGATISSDDTPLQLTTGDYTTVDVNTDTEATIEICSLAGYSVFVVIDSIPEVPDTVDLTLTILSPTDFLRGDADGDGDVDAASDAIYLLEYGFMDGTVPPCMDAADCDNDDVVAPILDAIFLLTYGFQDGDPPPDPGTAECGPDPTDDDDVDCLAVADECP